MLVRRQLQQVSTKRSIVKSQPSSMADNRKLSTSSLMSSISFSYFSIDMSEENEENLPTGDRQKKMKILFCYMICLQVFPQFYPV